MRFAEPEVFVEVPKVFMVNRYQDFTTNSLGRIANRAKALLGRREIRAVSAYSSDSVTAKKVIPGEVFQPDYANSRGGHHGACVRSIPVPAMQAFVLRRGKCIIGKEECFTHDGLVVEEITSQHHNPQVGKCAKKLANATRIGGVVANLSLSGLERNYYHCMVEYLARIYILKQSGIVPDWIICDSEHSIQREVLQAFGFRVGQFLSIKHGAVIEADQLVSTSLVNNWQRIELEGFCHYQKQWLPSWLSIAFEELRGSYGFIDSPPKKIYVSRKDAQHRKIFGEEAIECALERHGFQSHCLSGMTLANQAKLFSNAEWIVGAHGAGLTNMIFSNNLELKVMELLPFDYPDSSFEILARVSGVSLRSFLIDSVSCRGLHPQKRDATIDWSRIEQALLTFFDISPRATPSKDTSL